MSYVVSIFQGFNPKFPITIVDISNYQGKKKKTLLNCSNFFFFFKYKKTYIPNYF